MFYITLYITETNPIKQVQKELQIVSFHTEVFAALEKAANQLCNTICIMIADAISITGYSLTINYFSYIVVWQCARLYNELRSGCDRKNTTSPLTRLSSAYTDTLARHICPNGETIHPHMAKQSIKNKENHPITYTNPFCSILFSTVLTNFFTAGFEFCGYIRPYGLLYGCIKGTFFIKG